jgi:large subunit ribosomal protein L4
MTLTQAEVSLDPAIFGIEPNVPVMHQVVTAQLAARRAGTQSTKTRAEVRGGGAKPWKQKGTGRARQGSIRAPHWRGGGVALGPKPRSYKQRTPKKMIKLALRSALSDRAAEGKVLVVDASAWTAHSTKNAKAALAALGVTGRALLVLRREDEALGRSFRNLPEVQLCEVGELNTYDVLVNDWVIFTEETLPAAPAGETAVKAKPTKAASTASPGAALADTAPAAAADADADEDAPSGDAGAHADDAAEDAAGEDATGEDATGEDAAEGGAAVADERFGAGSAVPLADGSGPEGYEIKGNAQSMLYHEPGSRYYAVTKAEVYFASAEDAERAGFAKPGAAADSEDN